MAIYRVQGPDNRVYRIEGPDDAAEADILAFAESQYSASVLQAPPVNDPQYHTGGPRSRRGPRRDTTSEWELDPSKGSLLDQLDGAPSLTPPGVIVSKAPIKPEVRAALEAKYDAATPEQRAQLAARPGIIGQVLTERAQRYNAKDAERGSALPVVADALDPRAEKRAARLSGDGIDPEYAQKLGQRAAANGVPTGLELESEGVTGTVSASDFNFDRQRAWDQNPLLSNPFTRGIAKGGIGFAKGAAGLGEFVAELFVDVPEDKRDQVLTRRMQQLIDEIGTNRDAPSQALEGAISSITTQLPALATGNVPAALASMGLTTFGQEYSDGRAAKLDVANAATRAGLFGAFEIIGERFGLGSQLEMIKKAGKGIADNGALTQFFASQLKKEVPGELLTTTGQFLADKAPSFGLNQEAGWEEYLGQVGQTVVQTVLQGGLMSGGIGVINSAMSERGRTHAATDAGVAQDVAMDKWGAFGASLQPAQPAAVSFTPADSLIARVGITPVVVPVSSPVATAAPTDGAPIAPAHPAALASDADLLARVDATAPQTAPGGGQDQAVAAPGPKAVTAPGAPEPAMTWFGRRGDGYVTELDAMQALAGRRRMFGDLEWRVEALPSGNYRLAGYARGQAPAEVEPESSQFANPEQAASDAGTPAADSAEGPRALSGILEGRLQPTPGLRTKQERLLQQIAANASRASAPGTASTESQTSTRAVPASTFSQPRPVDATTKGALRPLPGQEIAHDQDSRHRGDLRQTEAVTGGQGAGAGDPGATGAHGPARVPGVSAQAGGGAPGRRDVDGTLHLPPPSRSGRSPAGRLGGTAAETRLTAQRLLKEHDEKLGSVTPTLVFNAPSAEEEAQVTALSEALGVAMGGKIVAFRDTRYGVPNGVQIGDNALVNVAYSDFGVAHTALHENFHLIERLAKIDARVGRKDSPAQKFVASMYSIFDDMTEDGKRAYVDNFLSETETAFAAEIKAAGPRGRVATITKLMRDPKTRSEMVADFLGNRAHDKAWWRDLAEKDPTGFAKFAQRWLEIVDNLLETLRGYRRGRGKESEKVDAYVRDLAQAKAVARDALIAYRRARGVRDALAQTGEPADLSESASQPRTAAPAGRRRSAGQAPDAERISEIRERHGANESAWKAMFGHDFDRLTAKEASYLSKTSAARLRDLLAGRRDVDEDDGGADSDPAVSARQQADANAAAEAAGFDTSQKWYHGTAAKRNFKTFKAGKGGVDELGPGVYFTSKPEYANAWARGDGGRVMPVYLRRGDVFDLGEFRRTRGVGPRSESDARWFLPLARRVLASDRLPPTLAKATEQDIADRIRATPREINRWLDLAGYVGARDEDSQVPGQIVVFRPENIRSVFANETRKELGAQFSRRQAAGERDLIIAHNLSEQNLLHAWRMGGIPVPSLAITTPRNVIDGFGEITLVGDAAMADPKGYANTKVFGADIYSPRYPTIEYKFSAPALKALHAKLKPYMSDERIVGDELRHSEGLTAMPAFRKWAEAEGVAQNDYQGQRAAAQALLREVGASERIFRGFTDSGNRRYTPHTLENVVKILKQELRGGEGFNYGVGSLRSKYAPQFRSVKQIKAAADLLVSKAEFEAVKKEIDAEFWEVAEQLQPYHPASKSFGFGDTVIGTLQDAATMGLPRALRENGFADVPAEVQREVAVFLNRLSHLPTEYFEAKILREVDLAEFRAAVAPATLGAEARQALASRGVRVEEYDRNSEGDRARVVARVASELPEVRFSAQQQAPLSQPRAAQVFDIPAETSTDKFRRKVQDAQYRLRAVQEAVRAQGGVVGEAQDAYAAWELMPGRVQGIVDEFDKSLVTPFIDELVRQKVTPEEIALYAYARHAEERNAQIKSVNPQGILLGGGFDKRIVDAGSGMTDKDAKAIKAQVVKEGRQKQFDAAYRALRKLIDANRQAMYQYGLITQQEFNALNSKFRDWVPLRGLERVDHENDEFAPRRGRGLDIRGAETMAAMGRVSRASSVLENILTDFYQTATRGERNIVNRALLDLVLQNPDPSLWEIDPQTHVREVGKKSGLIEEHTKAETRTDVVALKVAGKQVYIRIKDPLLKRALLEEWRPQMRNIFLRTMQAVNTLLRNTLTRYNPPFAVANAIRDSQQAASYILGELGARAATRFGRVYPKALAAAGRAEVGKTGRQLKLAGVRLFGDPVMDKHYEEFLDSGSITGGFYMQEVEDITRDINRRLVKAGGTRAIRGARDAASYLGHTKLLGGVATPAQLLRLVEAAGSISENATRFALYHAARASGATKLDAARIAKNGTTNFNRKGEWGPMMNTLYLYSGAAIQGARSGLHSLAKSKHKGKVAALAASWAGVGFALAMLGAAVGGENDNGEAYWDMISTEEKRRNWIIMLPPGEAMFDGAVRVGDRGRYIKVPMPYLWNLFPVMGMGMADAIRHAGDPTKGRSTGAAIADAVGTTIDNTNPIGGAFDVTDRDELLLGFSPTIFDIPLQFALEVNAFGMPVSPSYQAVKVPDHESVTANQAGGWGHQTSKWLYNVTDPLAKRIGSGEHFDGRGLSIKPGTIENSMYTLTGGTGRFVGDILSTAMHLGSDQNPLTPSSVPFLNKLYGEVGERQEASKAYERANKAKVYAEAMEREKGLEYEPRSKYEEAMLAVAQAAEEFQSSMSTLRKQQILVMGDATQSKVDRAAAANDLRLAMDEAAHAFNAAYLEIMGELEHAK